MKKYIIDEASLKAILDYLAGRPYREVAQAIEALSKLPEFEGSEDIVLET